MKQFDGSKEYVKRCAKDSAPVDLTLYYNHVRRDVDDVVAEIASPDDLSHDDRLFVMTAVAMHDERTYPQTVKGLALHYAPKGLLAAVRSVRSVPTARLGHLLGLQSKAFHHLEESGYAVDYLLCEEIYVLMRAPGRHQTIRGHNLLQATRDALDKEDVALAGNFIRDLQKVYRADIDDDCYIERGMDQSRTRYAEQKKIRKIEVLCATGDTESARVMAMTELQRKHTLTAHTRLVDIIMGIARRPHSP